MDKLKQYSYGKLNLMLNIVGLRPDGYHALETVMQTVSLRDTVEIKLKPAPGISLRCNLPYVPSDSRNIAWKAAETFISLSGYDGGMTIDIKKMIPVGGGMGGGSANAASVLDMLNKMCGSPLKDDRLDEAALSLGADVPFCLRRGAYLAEGIGERLSPLTGLPCCSIVVCKPRASVSSRTAYQIYDDYGDKGHFDYRPMADALKTGDIRAVAAAMGNSFQEPIAAVTPEIGLLRNKLLDMGALGAAMTGSGSVVFGIFEDFRRAQFVKTALRVARFTAYCVHPVNE